MLDWESRSGLVVVERQGPVAILRFDRADKLNALNVPMLEDVGSALRWLGGGEAAGAIVVTGTGRAFSAGDDLPATESLSRDDFDHLLSSFQELTRAVLDSKVPVLAALNGIAVGGAAEFTLVCDARIGYSGSDYLFPENDVGLTISNASTYLLPRLVGSRALPLILDAGRIDGNEAFRLGLIDHFVDGQGAVLPKAIEVARRWVERGLATPFHLKLLRPAGEAVEAAIARENQVGAETWRAGTPDRGISRFLEEQKARKQKP
ncbi:MAG: enoyl-CoA hydratase/isomerase family protein [Actinomycetota bacterium]|nr:enoyl-CoA hydratase/isomerase family protein [Actinomycetota bacterium]